MASLSSGDMSSRISTHAAAQLADASRTGSADDQSAGD